MNLLTAAVTKYGPFSKFAHIVLRKEHQTIAFDKLMAANSAGRMK